MRTAAILVVGLVISLSGASDSAHAQDREEAEHLFRTAYEHFVKGDYRNAVNGFDRVLATFPDHPQTLKMKAIAESNMGEHEKSLLNFYKAFQKNPDDVTALLGLGVGFGNFAEYQEAKKYFEMASKIAPDDTVVKNYNEYADKVIAKYPYRPTEKPLPMEDARTAQIPPWIKNNARWWAEGQISDSDFVSGIGYMIREGIISISETPQARTTGSTIPEWIKNNARWWANNQIGDGDFARGIEFLVENGIIAADAGLQRSEQELAADLQLFNTYVRKVAQTVINEKRYIEHPNPSDDVIKKFMRHYVKWNFDQQIQAGTQHFPDPTYEVKEGVYVIEYKLFVNEQPSGLPLDHVGTLDQSIAYWESRDFTTTGGNPAKIEFAYTNARDQATIWITWVVRDLGEGVLGHANLGKGVAEVALGGYGCDGSFQLYDVNTVEKIMMHELGHSVGLNHSSDPDDIMYPSLKPQYAYCLLR